MAALKWDIVFLYNVEIFKHDSLSAFEIHKIQNEYMHIFFSRMIGSVAALKWDIVFFL